MTALQPRWSGQLYGELAGEAHLECKTANGAVSGSFGLHRADAVSVFECSGSFDGRRLQLRCTSAMGDPAPDFELNGAISEGLEIKGDWSASASTGGGFVLFAVRGRPA